MRKRMRKVFISHAVRDKELAELIETLIEAGIGLPHNDVFCTSLEGLGIPEGTPDFKEAIRKELEGCDTVVALISHNYYASPFCMCELGAVWILAKNFFPVLVPPVDFKDLRGALTGMQCRKLEDQSTASALYTRLSKLVPAPVAIERWDVKKDVFYSNLSGVLARLPRPETVKVEELDRAKGERDRFKAISVELEQKCDSLKSQNHELAAAKDTKEVTAIQKKYSSEWEQFETLTQSCRAALNDVSLVIREALFHWTRNEAFEPSSEWDEDVTSALEDEMLTEDQDEGRGFWPNEERPKIKAAMKRIEALKRFLEKDISEGFHNQAIAQFGDTPDIKRRSFWQEQF